MVWRRNICTFFYSIRYFTFSSIYPCISDICSYLHVIIITVANEYEIFMQCKHSGYQNTSSQNVRIMHLNLKNNFVH